MNQDNGGIASETTVGLMPGACAADGQAACSLRKTAANLAAARNGPKDSLSSCEVEAFLLLAPRDRVFVLNHETGETWCGTVDTPFPERGFVWVVADFGQRKPLDIALHTVWRRDRRQFCGSNR